MHTLDEYTTYIAFGPLEDPSMIDVSSGESALSPLVRAALCTTMATSVPADQAPIVVIGLTEQRAKESYAKLRGILNRASRHI